MFLKLFKRHVIGALIMVLSGSFNINSTVTLEKSSQLPIVLVHGVFANSHDMGPTIKYLAKYLPEAYVKSASCGLGRLTSFCNMPDQVEALRQELQSDPHLAHGCIIIGHSQGGLLARSFIQKYNYPRVHTLITWGTPHRGVYGTPGTLDESLTWLNTLELHASSILYSSKMQKHLGFANYWCDTLNYNHYLKKCQFLPYLNNEKDHPDKELYKKKSL